MNTESSAGAGAFGVVFGVVMFAVAVVMIASMWKVFVKAGQPGWAAIVPIFNIITLLKITGKPLWWIVMFCIPFANFVVMILLVVSLAKCFGKSTGFGLGLIFLGPVFFPMLGFGDARYQGPEGGATLIPVQA
jgi:uncharacterized protein DUF5684